MALVRRDVQPYKNKIGNRSVIVTKCVKKEANTGFFFQNSDLFSIVNVFFQKALTYCPKIALNLIL